MEQQTSKAVLSTFICDFLQSTEGDQPGEPNLSKRPLQTTGQAEQQESASERADRKSARERRRRAEVGEKFDELAKVLASAEGQAPHILTRREVAEGSRVELLQRAIDVVTQLVAATKLTRDEESAAGGLLGVASRGRDGLNGAPRLPASLGAVAAAAVAPAPAAPAPAPADEKVSIMVVAQTSVTRERFRDLAGGGASWFAPVDDGAAVATGAAAAASACTSFIAGKGQLPLAPGPAIAPVVPAHPPCANGAGATLNAARAAPRPAPDAGPAPRKHSFDIGLPMSPGLDRSGSHGNLHHLQPGQSPGGDLAASSYYAPAA